MPESTNIAEEATNTKKKMGRPRLDIDKTQLEALCRLRATDEEIAGFFNVSTRTIERLRADEEYADVFRRGLANYKISLRRSQIQAASKGNAAMLIWLGKQDLGQRDRIEHVGDNGGPIQIETLQRDFARLPEADLVRMARDRGLEIPADLTQ